MGLLGWRMVVNGSSLVVVRWLGDVNGVLWVVVDSFISH